MLSVAVSMTVFAPTSAQEKVKGSVLLAVTDAVAEPRFAVATFTFIDAMPHASLLPLSTSVAVTNTAPVASS